MRYEELSLPLAGGPFHLRFHPRLTILAGLSSDSRADVVDALAAASAGQVVGGTLVYRDRDGRRVVVRDESATYLDDGSPAPGLASTDADEVRARLLLHPDEMGLPVPLSPEQRVRLEAEYAAAEGEVKRAYDQLESGRRAHRQRRDLLAQLEQVEAKMAAAGGGAELAQHRYHAALAELERVRATMEAVNAPPRSLAHDERLLTAAIEAHGLADEWSHAVDRLDELLVLFNDRRPLPAARLEVLQRVPEHPPADLTACLDEHEQAAARVTQLTEELEEVQRVGSDAPSDARILALATIDQETLWFTHRRVLLANEQLEQARVAAASHGDLDPNVLAEVEQAFDRAKDAHDRVEKSSTTGLLVVSLLVCVSLLLAVADLARHIAAPGLLAVALIAAVILLLKPRLAARRADNDAQRAVEAAGAESLAELRQRYADDAPDSVAWRRADEIIDEYESSLAAWRELVGNLTVVEVGRLEPEVHRFLAASDPREQARRKERISSALERAQTQLGHASQRITDMLAPYDLTLADIPHAIGPAIHDRIRDGFTARLQLQMADAQATEHKIAVRLEELLDGLGFREGNLEARVGALGWAIDEARQRQARRSTAPSREHLRAEIDRLQDLVRTNQSHMDSALPLATNSPADLAALEALRAQRDALRTQLNALRAPDLSALRIAHDRLALRLGALANELDTDGVHYADDTEERMVATLTNLRPSWFDASDDPMPAVLDEPFSAVPAERRGRLLNLVLTASETTQVVLLTSDPHIALWARAQAARNVLSLLEPITEAAPAPLEA